MKRVSIILVLLMWVGSACAGTITYSYDEQHRLSGVNYNNQATITYEYDEAYNLTKYEVLTDSNYLKPFLLYFSWLDDLLRNLGIETS